MKCLSLKQPFAQLIVEGRKTIELRSWWTQFRGDFLVHASKAPFNDQYEKFGYAKDSLPLGAIIGQATLTHVTKYESTEDWKADYNKHLAGSEFEASKYGFMLSNPIKFEKPIPYKGKLNFFEVPMESDDKCKTCGEKVGKTFFEQWDHTISKHLGMN